MSPKYIPKIQLKKKQAMKLLYNDLSLRTVIIENNTHIKLLDVPTAPEKN